MNHSSAYNPRKYRVMITELQKERPYLRTEKSYTVDIFDVKKVFDLCNSLQSYKEKHLQTLESNIVRKNNNWNKGTVRNNHEDEDELQ